MNDTSKPSVLIVGSLPPPAIGPSLATQRLIRSRELNDALRIHFLNISDHREPTSIGKIDLGNIWLGIRHALACWWILLWHWPSVVYVAFSQGFWGFLRDLTFIVPSLLLRRPVVLHLRGSEFGQFYRDEMPGWMRVVTRWTFRRVHRVIVLGDGLRKAMKDLVDPERIVVIPNGIDAASFQSTTPARKANTPSRLLFLSSLRERKGLFLFFRALAEVRKHHPELRATIAGAWHAASTRSQGEALLRELDLTNSVDFVGEIIGDGKIRLYAEHDVFVFPPIQPEGLPWVVLEAMSASLPVITTNQGAIAEVVQDGVTGFIVEPTPEPLAQRIQYLVENPGVGRDMGAAGLRRVEKHFSEAGYFAALRDVLLSAVRRGRAPESRTIVSATSQG